MGTKRRNRLPRILPASTLAVLLSASLGTPLSHGATDFSKPLADLGLFIVGRILSLRFPPTFLSSDDEDVTPDPKQRHALLQTIQRHIDPLTSPCTSCDDTIGKVSLRYTINRNGNVLVRTITHSSSSTPCDGTALRVLANAEPFPKLPEDWQYGTFEFLIDYDPCSGRSTARLP